MLLCKERPFHLTDIRLTHTQNVKDRKVVDFSSMLGAFGGFADPAVGIRFQTRLKQYATIWCCVNEHPGHIFYDWFWDVIPRSDRFGREWKDTWVPLTGP